MKFSSNDEALLSHNEDLNIGIQAIQTAVRTLVKNLYTQRASKGNFTETFPDILEGEKWQVRYGHLQDACLLELASIMVGLEHQGRVYTEMWYMTPDATGMTFIARSLETIKATLINMPDDRLTTRLRVVAAQTHSLELLKYGEKQEDEGAKIG